MAEIWGAALIGAGATLVAAKMSSDAAGDVADAQRSAANGAIDATNQNYNRTAANLNPYIDAGRGALSQLQALNSGDYSGFKDSPDYLFTQDIGLQGLDRSAAARGSLYSGGHSADVLKFSQGLAAQQLGNYRSSLMGLAGAGQNAASNLGTVGTGNAAAIGSALQGAANGTSYGAANQANIWGGATSQLAGLAGQQMQSSYIPQVNANYGAPVYDSSSLAGSGVQVSDIPQTIRPIQY